MKDRKYIIIKREEQIVAMLFQGGRLSAIHVQEAKSEENLLGNIYVGRVKNLVKNLDAAFVEIEPGKNCFLDLHEAQKPLLLNRSYDGKLRAEDEIIVQVSKEAVKTKPPALTCVLSLDGKYCAVTNGKPGIAYSAKLSAKTKERLRKELEQEHSDVLLAEYAKEYGIIIRTNAEELGTDVTPLIHEIGELCERLAKLIKNGMYRTGYSVLLQKPAGYLVKLRDFPAGWCDEIVTDEEDIYQNILDFARENPEFHLPLVRRYQDQQLPLAKLYAVETRLKEALAKKVWLKSGGYLLIEPTEALTVIDVNTGKTVSKKEAQENHFQTNMEAAEEIARQLILRNLSGIIIVDFINMSKEEHRQTLMTYFGDLLKRDTIKTTLEDITALGLVELTRMKTSKPLSEQLKSG